MSFYRDKCLKRYNITVEALAIQQQLTFLEFQMEWWLARERNL